MNSDLKEKYTNPLNRHQGKFKSDHGGTSGSKYKKKKKQGNRKRRRSYGPFDTFLGSGLSMKGSES